MECLKCKSEMFTAKLNTDLYDTGAYLSNKKKGLFKHEKTCGITCFVCPECGYIELKADNPKELQLE